VSAELITPAESVRLCELERIIQKGKDTFVEVGTALSEIRDSKLYHPAATFEDYCKNRWGFSKWYAIKITDAAKVVSNLDNCPIKPKTESQARPLAKLPAEKQPAAWERAQEIAAEESKPVAARHVEAAVLEVMPKEEMKEEPETVVVDGVKFAIPNPTLSDEAKAKGDAAEKESDKLWLLKSTWKNTSKKDRSAFLAWASSK
jgi:hypothetical protein